MQKVIDYKLLLADTASELSNLVKKDMKKNWVPSGTIVAFGSNLIQAMVMFEGE